MTRDLGRSRALIAAPALLILTLLFLNRADDGLSYYGASRLAQAASAVAIIAPICAALAAWEGSLLRSSQALQLAPVRSQLSIAARSLVPIVLLGLLGIVAATIRMIANRPSLMPRDFVLLAVPITVVAGHTSLAYVLGRSVPAVFAVPLAPVVSWLWIVYPIAVEPLWIRHLTGYFASCCSIDTVPTASAIAAPTLIGVAMVLASILFLSRLRLVLRLATAAAVLASSLAVAIILVSGSGADAVSARPTSELRCRSGMPRVCLWRENSAITGLVSHEARRFRTRLSRTGVATPDTVSETKQTPGRAWLIGVVPTSDPASIDSTLIQGLLPSFPACANSDPYPAYEAYWPVALWLARRAGARMNRLEESLGAGDRREVNAVIKLPLSAQLKWYRVNLSALRRCDVAPHLLTAK